MDVHGKRNRYLVLQFKQIKKYANSQKIHKTSKQNHKKSHTYKESRAHLRISFWNLLMSLKNNQLLKKLLKWANK